MRRVLIVNNTVSQDDVPFESAMRVQPDSVTISADSTAFDFCLALGEALAGFQGFDDVRLLEGSIRKDMSPLSAPTLERDEVELLCDEHGIDVVISLDRLLFTVSEQTRNLYGFQIQNVSNIEMSGVLRVYAPGRETQMTAILLSDTVAYEVWFEYHDSDYWDLFLPADQYNLLRESAKYLADKARTNFVPHWVGDVRWYYRSYEARWKQATAYADSEKWDKALDIWRELYERTSSWKKKARLCSNIAVGLEMAGDFEQALKYAKQSHQLMHDNLGAGDAFTKKQERYVTVLSNRIIENQKLRMQH